MKKRKQLTEKQKMAEKLKRLFIKYKPENERNFVEALIEEAVPTYQRGKNYGVMVGKRKMRLKTFMEQDALSYKDYKEIDKQETERKAKSEYQEALDRLNAIDEQHEKDHEAENENENDQDMDR